MNMKKGFLAGFLLSLIIVLLPVFLYMDAHPQPEQPGIDSPRVLAIPATPPMEPLPAPPAPLSPRPGTLPQKGSRTPDSSGDETSRADTIVMLKKPLPLRVFPNHPGPHHGIQTRIYDPDRIYTLRTAVSHVSLIDLPEEAKEVYMGDSKLFLAEVFGARVKVKPITYDLQARTNMIIYTLHKRLTFRILMVEAGHEDDLITFRSPRAETVVNLNPIRTDLKKKIEEKASLEIRSDREKSLSEAGPTYPYPIDGEASGFSFRFLGFSRTPHHAFGLLEARNGSNRAFRVTGIRIRRFRTSLLWEGVKHYDPREDWEKEFQEEMVPGGSKRFLIPVEGLPQLDGHQGFEVDLSGHVQNGPEIVLSGESDGGGH
ncbi:MAG: hypothetical protein ACYCTV_06985 [Leptospirales bacterium]